MSGMEIERKFLVKKTPDFRTMARKKNRICQAYMACQNATVRVRIYGEKAFLTIKSPSFDGGMSRYEFEKEITIDEAEHLMQLCQPGKIDKTRYLVPFGRHIFEVDEFYGENEGLIVAELELTDPSETIEVPPFLGMEVTGDRRFYNSHLRIMPFSAWRDTLPEQYR